MAPDVAGLPWPEGDPGGLRASSSQLSRAASALRSTGTRFATTARSVDVWSGQASTAYFAGVAQYQATFARASSTLTDVAGSLDELAAEVERAQDEVRELARKVEAAEEAAREAEERAATLGAAAAAARTSAASFNLSVGTTPLDSHAIALNDAAADATSAANAAAAIAADRRREAVEVRRRAERLASELCRDVEAADRATAAEVRSAAFAAPAGGTLHPAGGLPSSPLGRVIAPTYAPIFRHDSGEDHLPADYRKSISGLPPIMIGDRRIWPLSEDGREGDLSGATLPYLLTTDENGNLQIQYWRWHHYNDHPGAHPTVLGLQVSTGDGGLGNHDGDWEKFSVMFDGKGRADEAHFAVHETGVDRDWDTEVEMQDGHPVVYVAHGAHGSYWEAGSFDNEAIPVLHTDDQANGEGPVWDTRGDLVDGSTDSRLFEEGDWGLIGSPGGDPPMSPGDPRREPLYD